PPLQQGREFLRQNLRGLNLPPEEWAEEVKNLTCQLVAALELLREREAELDSHEELIGRYETHLAEIRDRVSALHRERSEQARGFEEAREAFEGEVARLREEMDALSIKARRLE
ncbi:unnamed protein product, partial [Discosporangium mesarthrocarpum]